MSDKIKNFRLNFGPQHPAAHGVLRFVIELNGEIIERADTHIGLLHRGTEKLMEYKTYHQNIPYFERMDYICPATQPYPYVLAIEKMLQLEVPKRGQYLRVLVAELSRISNHAIAAGALANDFGAITPFLILLEIREQIFEFIENMSGARMHANYYRIGGVDRDVPQELLNRIRDWIPACKKDLAIVDGLLTENRIFKQRTVGIGVISKEDALSYGFTGPNLRACGVPFDLRKNEPYDAYSELDFDVAVSEKGDTYDRYLIRMFECGESLKMVQQIVDNIPDGPVKAEDSKSVPPRRALLKKDMTALIRHFKLHSEGVRVPEGEIYTSVETPKGEFGVYIVSDGTNRPYRVKVRTTVIPHLSALDFLCQGHLLADIPAVVGSIDIIFGEADR